MTEQAFGFTFCAEIDVFHELVPGPFDVVVFLEHVFTCDGTEVVAVRVDFAYVRPSTAGLAVGDRFANKESEWGVIL